MKDQLALFAVADPKPDLGSYDWIVVSSSAGKDSMAMLDHVVELARAAGVLSRVVVVHADLGRVEWRGTRALAEQQANAYGLRFIVTFRRQGNLLQQIEERGKFPGPDTRFCTSHHKQNQVARVFTALATEARDGDLLEQVEERGMWPDAKNRYCTSDQKRAQVHRTLTALTNESAVKDRPVRILSCMGMRAQESPARAKRVPFQKDEAASNGRRHVDSWRPLHRWEEDEVWARIRSSRIADLVHPAYGFGMPRLSCCFCIFASKDALVIAGHHNPELLAEYVRIEEKIGHKFRKNLSMRQVADTVASGYRPASAAGWSM